MILKMLVEDNVVYSFKKTDNLQKQFYYTCLNLRTGEEHCETVYCYKEHDLLVLLNRWNHLGLDRWKYYAVL
jgi:hypothetical protein